MKKLGFEVRTLNADDLSVQPACFANDKAELYRHLNWCMFFLENDENPYFYMRNMEPDYYRWGGIVRLGSGPFSPHTSVHFADLAQKKDLVKEYSKVSSNPLIYGISSKEPFTDFTYTENQAHWIEGNVFDLTAEYFPYAIFVHRDSPQKIDYWHQYVILTGTYEGKQIKTLGCFDRLFSPKNQRDAVITEATQYIWSYFSGIRKDGRKECAYANIHEQNGLGVGFYWLEGEEPILSTDVFLEADWHRLSYVSDNDPTVHFSRAIWRFGGKEIHCDCKWGSKGFLEKPRLDTIGLSQTYGPWYEGNTPYDHEIWFNINENMGATVDKIKEMGFSI